MKALINGVETNLRVTSTVLESDPDQPDNFVLYHCWRCGNVMFQFSGNVLMIVPGGVRVSVPVIYLCRHCKTRHLINSVL